MLDIVLVLVMACAGGVASFVVNWRFLLVVCICLLTAEGFYALIYADLWNFVRLFVAIVALELGYLLGGLAPQNWRARSLDTASERRSLPSNKLPD